MKYEKREIIEKLKLEAGIIRDGGYNPSVRDPHALPRIFRDSVSCLNVGLEVKKEPCDDCLLMTFVPPEQRDRENPCHHIPLNEQGETVAILEAAGDRDKLEETLLSWLEKAISKAEKEASLENQ
jgi:hypothetical protein